MIEKLLAIQRLLFLVLAAGVVWKASIVRHPGAGPRPSRALSGYSALLCGLFVLLAAMHGFWLVAGGRVDGFRRVMATDPRAYRLRSVADRREVVDRHGRPLIRNVVDGDRVRREYVLGEHASHLTGYYDRTFGKTGLEAACDEQLSTWRPSALLALRLDAGPDPAGRYPPLKLTIDARLQRAAAEALGTRAGAVVVLNPAGGDVLALVSAPAFEPADIAASFDRLQADSRSPLLNRALAGLYPPGSTFKLVTAAAALAAGQPPDETFDAGPDGYLAPGDDEPVADLEATIAEREGRAWAGHGPLDLEQAMTRSANGYFAWLAVRVGPAAIDQAAEAFGLERACNLVDGYATRDLSAQPASLPRGRLKPGDVARYGIGQGELLVTPLAMAEVAATIANYGVQVSPRLLAERPRAGSRQALDPDLAGELQRLMRLCVTSRHGTARGLGLPGVRVAAKTGSAENPHGKPHSWVIAVAPQRGATIALAVLIENGGWGSQAAVPVARRVLETARDAGYFTEGRP